MMNRGWRILGARHDMDECACVWKTGYYVYSNELYRKHIMVDTCTSRVFFWWRWEGTTHINHYYIVDYSTFLTIISRGQCRTTGGGGVCCRRHLSVIVNIMMVREFNAGLDLFDVLTCWMFHRVFTVINLGAASSVVLIIIHLYWFVPDQHQWNTDRWVI